MVERAQPNQTGGITAIARTTMETVGLPWWLYSSSFPFQSSRCFCFIVIFGANIVRRKERSPKKNRSPETAHQEGERQEAEKDHGIATAPEAFASTMTPQGFPIMSISPNSPRQDDNASRIATTAVSRLAGPTKDSS